MTVVTFGVWDLLHIGHVRFLQTAASLGDKLFVGVQSDDSVKEEKGCMPIIPQDQRAEMVRAINGVTGAHVYWGDFGQLLTMFYPSVLVIGDDWKSQPRHHKAEEWCKDNHCRITRIRYTPGVSTTLIRQRVRS